MQMNNELERLWLEQLAREHEDICYQHRVELQRPIFELSGGTREMGVWLPELKTIRISRHLISEQGWDKVLMVLRHEMAHQFCSEVSGSNEKPHGPCFQKACRLLGVVPPYNRAGGDLAEVVARPATLHQTEVGRKTIARISKLLSLASSENENEAALAMQKATEIMQRYNLDQAEVAEENQSSCVRLTINTRARQVPAWRRKICAILRDYFFVEIIFNSLYDPESNHSFKTIELLGRAENVPVAEHCYYFLEHQLASLWKKNKDRFPGNRRTARNSYYLGVLQGFKEKMAAQARPQQKAAAETAPPATGAMIVAGDSGLQDFIAIHFPRLQTRKVRGTRIHTSTYDQAVDTGRSLVLHRSLGEKKQGVQGLLKK